MCVCVCVCACVRACVRACVLGAMVGRYFVLHNFVSSFVIISWENISWLLYFNCLLMSFDS